MTIPTLTTERLVLRGWTEDDAAPLYRIYCQEGVLRYFPKSDPPPQEHTSRHRRNPPYQQLKGVYLCLIHESQN